MPVGSLLLDTSAVIAHFRNVDAVQAILEDAERICISATVLGELRYGAERSARPDHHHSVVDRYLSLVDLLPVDEETAVVYGQIKSDLAGSGSPIPDNDIWIAASALRHGLRLLAKDQHYLSIKKLDLIEL